MEESLHLVTKEFASEKLDLHPNVVTNHDMGLILENAFIPVQVIYQVLNRMSAALDFKRLLTEFALGEFKRELQSSDAL